jgi:uncharacterized protein (DUF1697 family)
MARQIALLRAVNVGGHNKVPMARLRELMEELGYRDVSTYVQSGNVVFTATERPGQRVAARLEKQFAAEFGFEIDVIVRTRDELADIIAANPVGDVATDPAKQLVYFLAEEIDDDRLEGIDAGDVAPEVCVMAGREIHLWTPAGFTESKVRKVLTDKRLGVPATTRNWRTVKKLLELADTVP